MPICISRANNKIIAEIYNFPHIKDDNILGLFICISGSILAIHKRQETCALVLEESMLERRKIYEDAQKAMKVKDEFLVGVLAWFVIKEEVNLVDFFAIC